MQKAAQSRLRTHAPTAIAAVMNHASSGDSWLSEKHPKNQRMPSLLSRERMGSSGKAAVSTHESRISASWAVSSTRTSQPNLLFICMEVVDVDDAQF